MITLWKQEEYQDKEIFIMTSVHRGTCVRMYSISEI